MIFYIYGKFKNQKKFRAMDINEGIQVRNLIHATRLTKDQAEKFILIEAPKNAPEWEFKLEEAFNEIF